MARQGNYVTVPSGSANWTSGLSDSLSALSKSYLDQAKDEKDRAALEATREENKRRFDLQESRAAAAEQSRLDKENLEKGVTDFYRNFGDNFDVARVQEDKARRIFGLTDEELSGDKRAEYLAAIPVYQEDIYDYGNKQALSKFGRALDPNALTSFTRDYNSLSGLQEKEDARAERLQEAYDKKRKLQFDAGKALLNTGRKSDGSVMTYNDILVAPIAGTFKKGNFIPFTSSEAEKAQKVSNAVLGTLQNNNVSPYQAELVLKKTLDILKEGEDLNEIENNPSKVTEALNSAVKFVRENPNKAISRNVLEQFAAGGDTQTYNPLNIRDTRRQEALEIINRLRGNLPEPNAPSSSTAQSELERTILGDINKKNETPKVEEVITRPDGLIIPPIPNRNSRQEPIVPVLNPDGTLANEDEVLYAGDIPTGITRESAIAEANLRQVFPDLSAEDARTISNNIGNINNLSDKQEVDILGNITDTYGLDFSDLLKVASATRQGLSKEAENQQSRNERLDSSNLRGELGRLGEGALNTLPMTSGVFNVAGRLPNVAQGSAAAVNKLRPLFQDIRFTRQVLPAIRRFAAKNSTVPIRESRIVGNNPFTSSAAQSVDNLAIPAVTRNATSRIPTQGRLPGL